MLREALVLSSIWRGTSYNYSGHLSHVLYIATICKLTVSDLQIRALTGLKRVPPQFVMHKVKGAGLGALCTCSKIRCMHTSRCSADVYIGILDWTLVCKL